MEKLHASKTFLKMAGERMPTPHPTSLVPPLVIRYRNHQKNMTCFNHLNGTIRFVLFHEKAESKGGAWHNDP